MTAAPMDFVPIWDGIRAWVTALSGLNVDDVNWMDWPQTFAGAVQIRLNPLAMPMRDVELRYTDAGAELEAAQVGESMLTVSISVRSRSQDPAIFALRHAKLIEGGLLDPEQLAVLDALCISPVQVLRGPQIGSINWDERMEQLCTLDVEFSVSTEQLMGAVTWFNKVRVSSDTRNVDGSLLPDELQTDDEEIGPPP